MPTSTQWKTTPKATASQNQPKLCVNVKVEHGFKSHVEVT